MNGFDAQTLKDLEFNTLRDWLVNFALGETAQERLAKLSPSNDFKAIELALNQTEEFRKIRTENEVFPALQFEELLTEIKYLPIENAVLSQEGFVRIVIASELVNLLLVFFDKRSQDYPHLYSLLDSVYFTRELIETIEKVFDKKGLIRNDASTQLQSIRTSIQKLRNQINKNFEKEMRRFLKDGLLGETKEAFVNERRVLTVLSSHKRQIGGTVVGSSKTGSLTFIEPAVNIPLNNELELLLDDERKEIYRILQQLTAEISHHLPLIVGYQNLLCELDFISAKTRLALELNAVKPGVLHEMRLELIDAFHPILWKNNKDLGKKTQAQTILLNSKKRMLVISGPNAGGKSITLKTVGLLQLMVQAGLLIPVHPNSKICFFQQVLTDIGDNQSIENELSTYSYRLKRMRYFLKVSNHRSLLLLDEFGTGSDPELGGALAEVFFEELYKKKSFAVITTHYTNIKLKAENLPQAINGSMLFDTDSLAPLYRFIVGRPGSSFTFEVAQMNGISMNLIELAKSKLDNKKVKIDQLLSDLHKEKLYLERLNQAHIEAQEIAETARLAYVSKKEHFENRLKIQQEQIEKNNEFVVAGKKMKAFIQRFQTAKKKNNNVALLEDVKKYFLMEKSKEEDVVKKTTIKKAIQQHTISGNKKPIKAQQNKIPKDDYFREKIIVGSTVKLIETKQTGKIEELKGEIATVTFGFIRMKIEKEKLMWIS